ncbi:MAG: aldo/keto reductase [Chloroflexi bacterium]|nr:aldo/keto reductase [Chloroflexota bacterium]
MESISDRTVLHNGVKMPWLGLGVLYLPEGGAVENAVSWALEAGYRHIDTASIYGNEKGVGRAVRQSGIPREDIFVTTKVWNRDQGYERTLEAFKASLKRLEMEYVDLYLVHWPVKGLYQETWHALETIYESGRARAIGVSNFLEHHLQDVLDSARIFPMVNQVEFHPYLQQPELQAFCRKHNIQLEAWRPIMKGKVMEVPELVMLAEKYGKNPVQITLRWIIQRGIVAIPKSANKERIRSNADIFDFVLAEEDMALIDGLDRHQRLGQDPDHFHFDI